MQDQISSTGRDCRACERVGLTILVWASKAASSSFSRSRTSSGSPLPQHTKHSLSMSCHVMSS